MFKTNAVKSAVATKSISIKNALQLEEVASRAIETARGTEGGVRDLFETVKDGAREDQISSIDQDLYVEVLGELSK